MDKKHWILVLIIIISFSTHFAFLNHPNEIVFDEVHFGKFITDYYTREYFFDIHPPLAKLSIAGFASLFNFQPEIAFANIGEKYPDNSFMILRFLPRLMGALLPIVIFLLALELGFSRLAAFFAAFLVAIDNALITQSLYILTDSFLLLFGFLSLLFYFRYSNKGGVRNLIFMAVLGALAFSVKWTGLTFLALAGIIESVKIFRDGNYKPIINLVVFFAVIPLLIYYLIFSIHFSLLYKSGPGNAFMTQEFRKGLEGSFESENPDLKELGPIQKFLELNTEMYLSNKRLGADHSYSSRWYTWPLMTRSVFYWVEAGQKIYLIGNPFVWWASTTALIYLFLTVFKDNLFRNKVILILLGGYLLNLLPFIGIERVMFLYHYFTALIFAILIMAYLMDKAQIPAKSVISLVLIASAAFLYFSPLTYGLEQTPKEFRQRIWLKTWE